MMDNKSYISRTKEDDLILRLSWLSYFVRDLERHLEKPEDLLPDLNVE